MEIEHKFSPVPPGGFEKLLQDDMLAPHLGRQTLIPMRTTYYEVPGDGLGRAGFMLRLRQEGDKMVCCLKGPAGADGARLELETDAATIGGGLAAIAAMPAFPAEAAHILRGQDPVPRCAAAFTRTSIPYNDGGLAFALCYDTGQAEGGGKTSPIKEIELEYQSGSLSRFHALCAALAARHGLRESGVTKAKRAFALLEE